MPQFSVEHTTNLNSSETFKKVQEYLKTSQGLRKLDPTLTCEFNESSMTGSVKGNKFSCTLRVEGSAPTKVVLEIQIPLLFSPFKGQIQDSLKNKMSQILG
ncbi:MAG: polyhydroxyalkanoic acid system family protein [Oligoflexia bacterium]|nr:polyhydroxyalkanoic acid system family protein [Oligoflexia bacterium]